MFEVILATGELNELEELKRDSDVIALRELRSVWIQECWHHDQHADMELYRE